MARWFPNNDVDGGAAGSEPDAASKSRRVVGAGMEELMTAAPHVSSRGEEADMPRGPDGWPEWMTGGFVPPTHADDQGSAADYTESEIAEENSDE